ncbi:ATP-dependent DNA helicase [Rhynchospora pubera]|uniref:ATP-dependent DNA helicase n=1 Tax=Rhynchospora pubera TaxID=906938 RepID=A0AAV8HDT9_9POAL|nr:ATP-dependent DNA helicase [Rhynchospora pubera]KAJ4763355.1 ATP-dependent DNA helicase [Rhynchospora pubera]KAJ4815839.1 ATP-dependent DNA helicase [Rhynchospora pubera]
MVQFPNLQKISVKSEREDYADSDFGSNSKKPKIEYSYLQQWGTGKSSSTVEPEALQHNLVSEPSPLGLRLKKSPSFLDFVQAKLSQLTSRRIEKKKKSAKDGSGGKAGLGSSSSDKLKASNFPASLLRIGNWERVSRYEGDLVGKVYFAKQKLVWEVLDGGLKSKIEIPWSDIAAIKASFPEEGPETLEIVLSRQPLFSRETTPTPRKHTLWQPTSDFTGGQATTYRRHYLECPQGLMSRHFEKLVRCDPRLSSLSQQPSINLENPFFEHKPSVFEEGEVFNSTSFQNLKDAYQFSEPETVVQCPLNVNHGSGSGAECHPNDCTSSRDSQFSYNIQALSNHFNVPGLRPSMSRSEIVNHIGHHICRKLNSSSQNQLNKNNGGTLIKSQFEELAQYLLADSQNPIASTDEKYLMSRVNSLCSLIQKDERETREAVKIESDCKANLKPNDSFGDLLLSLPRIASFPHFL